MESIEGLLIVYGRELDTYEAMGIATPAGAAATCAALPNDSIAYRYRQHTESIQQRYQEYE